MNRQRQAYLQRSSVHFTELTVAERFTDLNVSTIDVIIRREDIRIIPVRVVVVILFVMLVIYSEIVPIDSSLIPLECGTSLLIDGKMRWMRSEKGRS